MGDLRAVLKTYEIMSGARRTDCELSSSSAHQAKTRGISKGAGLGHTQAPMGASAQQPPATAPGTGLVTPKNVMPEGHSLHTLHGFLHLPQKFLCAGSILVETKYCPW